MTSKANAAASNQNGIAEAAKLYLDVVSQFPEHSLAPSALYDAAFIELKNRRYPEAIALTKKFQSEYGSASELPGVLEVQGDSYLLNGDAEAAEQSFAQLVQQFENDPKLTTWKLRVGQIRFVRKNYEQAIAWLTPLARQLQKPEEIAEALHWIGSS